MINPRKIIALSIAAILVGAVCLSLIPLIVLKEQRINMIASSIAGAQSVLRVGPNLEVRHDNKVMISYRDFPYDRIECRHEEQGTLVVVVKPPNDVYILLVFFAIAGIVATLFGFWGLTTSRPQTPNE